MTYYLTYVIPLPLHLPCAPSTRSGAWCIGTAVKNSYDYQLYVLEKLPAENSEETSPTVLKLLVTLLSIGNDEAKRKALYAISASSRGNPDVQMALLSKDLSFIPLLHQIVTPVRKMCNSSIELERKVWSFVSDMLEERDYIQTEFLGSLDSTQRVQALEQLAGMDFIGDRFLVVEWIDALLASLTDVIALDGCPISVHETASLRASIFNRLKCLESILKGMNYITPELVFKIRSVATKLIDEETTIGTPEASVEIEEEDVIDEKGILESDIAATAKIILGSLAQKQLD